ncbi:MAG: hypothetical protein A2041_14750 [Bacteroidetes bacterium GWA2_31_9b]|nr:MAG: hypothetical protein A2041_14750 [Bacteroidetes bacterium GWA2_31_9b]
MLRKVYIELTDSCNLSCDICFRHQWVHKPMDMYENVWETVVKQIKESAEIHSVVLGGMGEPLLSPFFEKTVNELRDKNLHVTSNATLFRAKLTTDIVKNIHSFVVSIDGMQEQMYQGRGVVFDDLISNLDFLNYLKKMNNLDNPFLDIQFVVSRKNIQDIFPLMDVLASKNIRNIVISHLVPQNENQAGDILYSRYENKEMKEMFHKIKIHSFKRGLRMILPEVELKTERKCAFVDEDSTFITSSGEIVPCYRLSHPGREVIFGRPKSIRQYSFGNVINKTILQLWDDSRYVSFRNKIHNNHIPSCPDCDLVDGCGLVHDTEFDCEGVSPSCSDCMWSRKFVFCS